MANSKISALTSATTPLAGTETLPIVQGGATVKTTVANITNGGGYAGSFTTLDSSGNTTLGDASTDTVRVNGYMGVGGAANIANALTVGSPTLSGTTQRGIDSATTFGTGATASVQQIRAISTLTTAGVYAEWIGLNVPQPQGTGYTLTNAYGLYISDQTKGTNNYGITSLVSSGTNKWSIYASGTAQNGFAGNVRIGSVVAPTVALDVTGAVKVSTTITPLDNVVQGTAAKGFDFSANTPLAGKTSTILNWYEEGTWTPNQGAGLTLVGAFSSTGKYTRIGRNVTVSGTVTGATSVAVTAAGVITTNLPFTIGTAGHGNATNAANTASAAVICNTGTTLTSAGAITATGTITFSATYFV